MNQIQSKTQQPNQSLNPSLQIKNALIQDYLKVDKIVHEPTRRELLWRLQCHKEKLFANHPLDELQDFNSRIAPKLPTYGILYE